MTITLITDGRSESRQTVALHLARQGHHVFTGVLNLTTEGILLQNAARDEGLLLDVIQLDVTDQASAERAVDTVLAQAGKLDVLINSANMNGGGALEETAVSTIRNLFETNFFGAVRMMQLVLPIMREAMSGTIVNVSSIAGRLTLGGVMSSGFASSKFALEAASETLAQEMLQFNVRIAIIELELAKSPTYKEDAGRRDILSPYYALGLRGERFFDSQMAASAPPEYVAKVIQHAIETEHPKLRYLVGINAKKLEATQSQMSNEAWVNYGREACLDEYAQFVNGQMKINA